MLRQAFWVLSAATVGVLGPSLGIAPAAGQEATPSKTQAPLAPAASPTSNAPGPVLRTTTRLPILDGGKPQNLAAPNPRQPGEHPLAPILRWTLAGLPSIEGLQDYSALLVKRERVNGQLRDYEYLTLKVRHRPFSVYVGFLAPAAKKGQEAIYIQGQNNGNLWAHQSSMLGTMSLAPDGAVVMRGQRYPITEIGLLNLVRRMVETARHDILFDECEVKVLEGAKVNGRPCTLIQVVHPQPRRHFKDHLARIFVDNELHLPIRYESFDWPEEPGGQPKLIEEYTFLDLKLNNGLGDMDFSVSNPQYRFPAARR